MNNEKVIKIIGICATVVGMGATLVSNWVGEKNLDAKVTEKVAKALAEQTTKTELQ